MEETLTAEEYITAELTAKEAKERAHFLAFFSNDVSHFETIRPGDDSIQEPDIVVTRNGVVEGYEITELWLSQQQAYTFYNGKPYDGYPLYPAEGKTTHDLLEPLRERLDDKFRPFRKDGHAKYSMSTTLIVVDRTDVPFKHESDEIGKGSAEIVHELLHRTTLGSRVQTVFWFVPSVDSRTRIAYP